MAVIITENKSLASYHTFGLKSQAAWFVEINSEAELLEVLKSPFSPKLVLGGGSNVFFSKDYPGLVIKNSIGGIEIKEEDDVWVVLKVGGGVIWHDLVLWSIGRNFGGLENLSLIPGTVGAAPIQNIGAYGVEFDSVFDQLEAIRIDSGEKVLFSKSDCAFGYRDSIFKRELKGQFVVTFVEIRLRKGGHQLALEYGDIRNTLKKKKITNPTIKDVSDAVITIRKSKLPDPSDIGNAGSFFKNPIVTGDFYEELLSEYPDIPSYPAAEGKRKLPAAWLIEHAGWKGFRKGDAGVYDRHALVLVNHGNATGTEMYQLAEAIRTSIFNIFGISLESEVNMI